MNMSPDDVETLRMSALLHDVGKIAIDDAILKKPAALTDAEYEIMKTHPQRGYKIMSQIPGMEAYLPGMYMHHEMVNGKGYPQGLTDEQIPLQAKIVSVADTFDAMTIDRPYSKGMLLPEALRKIKEFVGTRYDPSVVDALVRGCEAGEIGRGVVMPAVVSTTNAAPSGGPVTRDLAEATQLQPVQAENAGQRTDLSSPTASDPNFCEIHPGIPSAFLCETCCNGFCKGCPNSYG